MNQSTTMMCTQMTTAAMASLDGTWEALSWEEAETWVAAVTWEDVVAADPHHLTLEAWGKSSRVLCQCLWSRRFKSKEGLNKVDCTKHL